MRRRSRQPIPRPVRAATCRTLRVSRSEAWPEKKQARAPGAAGGPCTRTARTGGSRSGRLDRQRPIRIHRPPLRPVGFHRNHSDGREGGGRRGLRSRQFDRAGGGRHGLERRLLDLRGRRVHPRRRGPGAGEHRRHGFVELQRGRRRQRRRRLCLSRPRGRREQPRFQRRRELWHDDHASVHRKRRQHGLVFAGVQHLRHVVAGGRLDQLGGRFSPGRRPERRLEPHQWPRRFLLQRWRQPRLVVRRRRLRRPEHSPRGGALRRRRVRGSRGTRAAPT